MYNFEKPSQTSLESSRMCDSQLPSKTKECHGDKRRNVRRNFCKRNVRKQLLRIRKKYKKCKHLQMYRSLAKNLTLQLGR